MRQFLTSIGGVATLFGLIVAIEDNIQRRLVQQALGKIFNDSPEGAARMLAGEVIGSLLSGLAPASPKHVRMVCLQQAHLYVRRPELRDRLRAEDMFTPILALMRESDVDLTEEAVGLLRHLGQHQDGVEKIINRETLETLFNLAWTSNIESSAPVASVNGGRVMDTFLQRVQTGAPGLDSIVLLRILTLLTQIACGAKLPSDPRDDGSAVVSDRAWSLYTEHGVFEFLLELASIAPDNPHHDILVQLNALELLEEVVTLCPRLDNAFSLQLTRDLLNRSRAMLESAPVKEDGSSASAPTVSFIAVAVLRVFNKLAGVSSAKSTPDWYHEPAFLLFLSACANNYDDESIQTESIDLLATLGSFDEGLKFFSTVTSSLPASVAPSTTAAYLSNAYASALTPILLYQIPFFVYGTNYAAGLRQLSALHGMSKMLMTKYPDAIETLPAPAAASSSPPASSASPSSLLSTFFSFLHGYNPNKPTGLDVLLILAKQPFEDVREAVWKVVLGVAQHEWVHTKHNHTCTTNTRRVEHRVSTCCSFTSLCTVYLCCAGCLFDCWYGRFHRVSPGS